METLPSDLEQTRINQPIASWLTHDDRMTVSDVAPSVVFVGENSEEWPKGEAPEVWKVDRRVGIKGEIHPITAIEVMVHWLLFTQAVFQPFVKLRTAPS